MCGICGKISYGPDPIKESLITKMCGAFEYRGPDDRGIYTKTAALGNGNQIHVGLGHQRLSIIDLSHAGQQPMSNEDGSVWITFNGEIYNFKEVRSKLEEKGHTFRSDTDTEVIIHLYEEKGFDTLKHLNGMFAFAIWDEKKKRLWACRDRAGIKPLVYFWNGNNFIFASEIKALLKDPIISKELNYDALTLYLAFNYIPSPHTIFKGIKKLRPGQFLILQNNELEVKEYWNTPKNIETGTSSLPFSKQKEIFKGRLYSNLDSAVTSRMNADVPLGAFLSGGIDSSVIVALMARNSVKPIKTFSIGFKNENLFDETHYAREVANLYHTDHHEFFISARDLLDVFVNVLSTFDEPFADSSAIPSFLVSRKTGDHVTVALSGDGGDELFGGYRSYLGEYWYPKYMLVPTLLRKLIFEKLVQLLPDSRDNKLLEYNRRIKKFIKGSKGSFSERQLSLKEVFPQKIRQKILMNHYQMNNSHTEDPALIWIKNLLQDYKGDTINRILYSDFKDSLPGDMLTKVDWMSMKNSL
ncbi:MAG: asparagine synthase (glutamine-hydrolyzing), partial [Thermoplasmatales archaeon]